MRVRTLTLVLLFSGCIRAPEIVLVDRATALEQQAGGSFPELERKMVLSTLTPRPVLLTPEQLEALGIAPPTFADRTERTDADRVDDLLRQHCLGEARDGMLVDTKDACRGAFDRAQAIALVERTNVARQQLWYWMKSRRPELTIDEVRRRWRKVHVQGLICGGWIERNDGTWEAKGC
jgi:hypothetical protein